MEYQRIFYCFKHWKKLNWRNKNVFTCAIKLLNYHTEIIEDVNYITMIMQCNKKQLTSNGTKIVICSICWIVEILKN